MTIEQLQELIIILIAKNARLTEALEFVDSCYSYEATTGEQCMAFYEAASYSRAVLREAV